MWRGELFSSCLAEECGSCRLRVCGRHRKLEAARCKPLAIHIIHNCIQFCNILQLSFFCHGVQGATANDWHGIVVSTRCSFLFTQRRRVSRGCHRRCARISCALRACGWRRIWISRPPMASYPFLQRALSILPVMLCKGWVTSLAFYFPTAFSGPIKVCVCVCETS